MIYCAVLSSKLFSIFYFSNRNHSFGAVIPLNGGMLAKN